MSSEPDAAREAQGRRGKDGAVERCDVLILGASFAGVEVLLQLQRRQRSLLRIVVVDRQTHHGYLPLVHERLCDRIAPERSQLATAAFVEGLPGARFVEDEVVGLDPDDKCVTLGSGRRIRARFVVVALGSVLAPPETLRGGEHLLRYKTADALSHTRARLESVLGDGGETSPRLVVVGGGISGVELAGELAYLRAKHPARWRVPEVTLVSATDRLLPELARGVGRVATTALRRQGVDLRLGTRLVEAKADAVVLRTGERTETLPCAAAFWSGGVRPAPVLAQLDLPRTDAGWLQVGPTLQCFATPVPTRPDLFACGDAVRVVGGEGEWPTMQRAIECLWQAKVVARNVATLADQPASYPQGVPSLIPHVLRPRFAYGVSLGAQSLVVYGRARIHVPRITVWFRRWLMRQYFARYASS